MLYVANVSLNFFLIYMQCEYIICKIILSFAEYWIVLRVEMTPTELGIILFR